MGGVAQLSYAGIGLAVFGQQFCLPLPSMLLLMSAGAFAAEGQGHLRLSLVLLSGMLGCLGADGFWFWLGRRWGHGVIRLVCSLTSDPRRSRERSRSIFDRWGLRLLLVAKFFPGLDGVSPPLAGAEGATVRGFLIYDTGGSFLWTAGYISLGYLFSRQVDAVFNVMTRLGSLAATLVGAPLALFVLYRAFNLVRIIRQLRLRTMSPALLKLKLETPNNQVAVFDLLDYEAREEGNAGIPGALRVDPQRLRNAPKLILPEGLDVVLYCSSRNELVSARVAEALMRRGFSKVWVLEGGLDAWIAEGLPVTLSLCSAEELAVRLGVELPPELRQTIPKTTSSRTS